MTYQGIKQLIASFGFSYTYYSFPEKQAPALPYVLFYFPNSNNFNADDAVYQPVEALNIELYTKDKDFTSEAAIEAVLAENGIPWEKAETYLPTENMYEVIYQTEVIINGE